VAQKALDEISLHHSIYKGCRLQRIVFAQSAFEKFFSMALTGVERNMCN